MKGKYRWDKKYLYWGVTAFLVIASCLLFFWILIRMPEIMAVIKKILGILSPFIWGMILAYLLNPLMNQLETRAFKPLAKRIFEKSKRKQKNIFTFSRGLSLATSILLAIMAVFILLWMILPQLYYSIESIVQNINNFMPRGIAWVEETLENYPMVEDFVINIMGNATTTFTDWIANSLMPQMSSAITVVTSGVWSLVSGIMDVLIGLIISCYIIYNKERFGAQIKMTLCSLIPTKTLKKILNGVSITNKAFTSFLSGKLLDSLIIALICYIGCSIMNIPYTVLVSVIIGITNIIPFFGPIIGGVPTTLIILMVSPVKGLIYAIFVILLQQFDGNILGPKILGGTTGMSGFWIMFAILVGGGMFGFVGMICGVPVFSIIYTAVRGIVFERLERKKMPIDSREYYPDRFSYQGGDESHKESGTENDAADNI
ncbi:AI-2E family transporter [Clostridiaceae bacterium OttesenSCG-928-D20]|nr:AI-2E family transporter [Clostridiaceae bacterium OttesenSCG-928-D20]